MHSHFKVKINTVKINTEPKLCFNIGTNGIQVRHAKRFHSLDILNQNTDSQAAMTQSVEQAISAREVLDSSLERYLLFE